MSLKRLTPTVKHDELGYLLLWRDELAEIVRLTRQLPGANVRIEADGYELDEVETDLPKLGPQLSYFSMTVTKAVAENNTSHELLSLRLSKNRSWIKATDPDLTTMGLIDQIRSLANRCRRKPRHILHFLGYSDTNAIHDFIPGLAILAFVIVGSAILTGFSYAKPFHIGHTQLPSLAFVLLTAGLVLLLVAALAIVASSKTILFTGTRSEAPTWWQRHRTEIGINVGIGLAFYLLGLLTAHL